MTVLLSTGAQAALAQDPLCDDALFEKMVRRANLLGQQDTAIMENLVYKADSVLEYTCFNSFMDVAVNNMSYYMTPFYINDIIKVGVTNYLFANFGHTFMGDRLPPGPAGTPPPVGTYVCDAMTFVWQGAKCNNFAQIEPQDRIYGLEEFATATDIRVLVGTCTAPGAAIYGDIPVTPDPITTAFQQTPTDCGTPIATGMVINQPVGTGESRPVTYNEKICPNASCNYTPTGMDSGTCDP